MRSRNMCLFLALAAVMVPVNAVAEEVLLYDVDFGTPPHTPGLPPVTGAGDPPRDTPTGIVFGNPTVVTALGALTDQPCAFGNGTCGYDQLEFVTGTGGWGGFDEAYDSYYIEMDVLIEQLDDVVIWNSFTILLDTPEVRNIYFRPDHTIRFWQPGHPYALLGTYEFGVPVFIAMNLDIVSGQLVIWLDDEEVYAGQVSPQELRSIRLNLNGERTSDSAAVDNIRIYGGGSAPCQPPTISEQPQSQTVLEGGPVTFTVVAQGTPPLSYQWLKDGLDIPDATGSSYTIDAATFDDEGAYEVVASNDCGEILSDAAFLTVEPAECVDIDGDGDTDWSDIAILAHDWGCGPPDDCIGDLSDGYTDADDLAMLVFDWACPDGDGSCDEPGSGLIDVSVIEVDNSSVAPGADPFEPEFDGGVTHFTFDLQITVPPGEDWGVAEGNWVLTDPDVQFFLHALDFGGNPPDPFFFEDYPALEFDSYWCAASDIPPGGSGELAYRTLPTRTASGLSRVWLDVYDMGEGTFSIARFTIIVPPDSEAIPMVVPAGSGGEDPVVGTITGWVTNSSYTPGCGDFAFDIVLHSTCQCVADIDNDCDVDWSDLAIMIANWNCTAPDPCYADLDGDGDTDQSDLAMLLVDWGCPDQHTGCDEPGPSVLDVAVSEVDNTDVDPGEDSLAPEFNGSVTHFTFDLHVIADPYEDWGAAEMHAQLTEPSPQFFRHTFDFGGYPPDPSFFDTYPALEFDSYWMAASVIEPDDSGLRPQLHGASRSSTELYALWSDLDDTGEGVFTIARFTVAVPPDSEIHPLVVPTGSGGDQPLLGTITGWVTNTSLNPGCTEIAFDIIGCGCGGDIDGDCDTDQSDLGILLAAWDSHPGDPNWNWRADLNGDDHVSQSDLGILLADWGCPLPP